MAPREDPLGIRGIDEICFPFWIAPENILTARLIANLKRRVQTLDSSRPSRKTDSLILHQTPRNKHVRISILSTVAVMAKHYLLVHVFFDLDKSVQ